MLLDDFYSTLKRWGLDTAYRLFYSGVAMNYVIKVIIVFLIFGFSAKAVDFRTHKLTEQVHVLFGQGGNIAIHIGDDGTYIVDDQFAKLSAQIKQQISALKPGSPEFVINTHFHGDHTGGNEAFSLAGSHVIAHDNVHKRLVKKHGKASAYLPRVSFDNTLTLHFNNEQAHIAHFAHAHTDGDAVVTFTKANIVHMGDLYFNLGGLPFVDVDSGGSVDGLLKALHHIVTALDDNSVVIPGHGAVSNKAELLQYIARVEQARTLILNAMTQAATQEEMVKFDPLSPLNLPYTSWLPKERVTQLFYRSLKKE
ncbi:hypothetical protein PCIT_a4406 [Pseudoalteromonas citrea]|uniref:beta-lactamase n=3 Tax=Pseudoalteromonas citrea TaxID=43655 RepID=A0AAD4FQK3_9GAMM|nr:hypothetical protein PCIT_a4406 [Pseudoalteromonas citrea]